MIFGVEKSQEKQIKHLHHRPQHLREEQLLDHKEMRGIDLKTVHSLGDSACNPKKETRSSNGKKRKVGEGGKKGWRKLIKPPTLKIHEGKTQENTWKGSRKTHP